MADDNIGYTAHWEADVVLSDGATAHLRPIRPVDAERLVEFYARVSDESKYNRFFAPYPRLSERDVKTFTQVDHTEEDQLFGPMVSFGVSGVPTDLLGDRSYRIPPLTDVDAAEMIREINAAPLLQGYRGSAPADHAAIADLLHRVSLLIDDLPEVTDIELNPVLVGPRGLAVVNAAARIAPPDSRYDWYARRLS